MYLRNTAQSESSTEMPEDENSGVSLQFDYLTFMENNGTISAVPGNQLVIEYLLAFYLLLI